MYDDAIRVSWRALLAPLNGAQPVHGRLRALAKEKVVVGIDHNLMPGHRCNLTLMLPKEHPDEPGRFVAGNGVVLTSIQSSMQFHVTLKWEKLDPSGEKLLNEHVRRYQRTWKNRG